MRSATAERPSLGEAPRRSGSVYALKRRFVLAQATPPPFTEGTITAERLMVRIYSSATRTTDVPESQLSPLVATIGEERLRRRLAHPDVTLVLGIDRFTQRPTGFRWILHPRDRVVWHDNVPVEPGIAYGFNAYTFPEYRRQGLYKQLVRHGNHFLLRELGCAKVTIVVESSNQASLGANLDAGYELNATNYLVKVLGRNVLSVFRDHTSGAVRAHWVYRRGSRSGL